MWLKGGPGASGRVLPPVTGRSRVRVAVSSHCTGDGKACHWHSSPDPAQSGSSLHWVCPLVSHIEPFIFFSKSELTGLFIYARREFMLAVFGWPLARKLEDTPRKSKHIIIVFHRMERRRENLLIEFLDVFSKVYFVQLNIILISFLEKSQHTFALIFISGRI